MPTAAKFEQERQELASILASGIFSRAPGLAHLLIYICERYFEGEANQIKEYNIAVEALGRPAEFDQKRDSIVRVEAHRLRRRLKEYYEEAGASHAVRIIIPSGQYAPQFHFQKQAVSSDRTAPANEAAAVPEPLFEAQLGSINRPSYIFPARSGTSRTARFTLRFALVGLALLAAAVFIGAEFRFAAARASMQPSVLPDAPVPVGPEVRILAGTSQPYTDHFGVRWSADRDYEGGSAFSNPNHPIFGTRDPDMYRSGRIGSFRYDIPLAPGVYELRLHFAETVFGEGNSSGGGETSRLFNVLANGKPLLDMIDVIADAGPNAADIRVFKDIQPGADGLLHLEYKPVVNVAFLNAIEIVPGIPGRLRPIRIIARDQPYVDRGGRSWSADRFFQGGQLVLRTNTVSGGGDPEIYRSERFGNLTYAIPVARGRYSVFLHFAETWFGPDKPQRGGSGSRVFDILCNGVALAREFDIFKDAGADRAIVKTFHSLEPNPQGKLVLSLVPHRNYSCINAIEILDDAEPPRHAGT